MVSRWKLIYPLHSETQLDLADGIQRLSILPEHPSFPTTAAQIDRLPPETLAAIFVHLSKEERDSHGRNSSSLIQDLVSITHVCRFWRQVAINAPDLWNKINTTNLEAVDTFLERSGAVPLSVDLRPLDREILLAVTPHVHRFRQFSLSAPRDPDYNPFVTLTKPAPLLERLGINYPAVDFGPYVLFDDQVPRLRELEMFTNGVWLQNQLGNLTSLDLTLRDTVSPRSNFPAFLDMLRRCPVLEEMVLWWNIWDVAPAEPNRSPTVPLHRLRKLLLRSFSTGNIKYLLRSLAFMTNEVAIHLNAVNLETEGEDFVSELQTVFPNNNTHQPSLLSSTKLELIFHTQPRTVILHAIGPRFAIRMDTCLDEYGRFDKVNFTFHDVFPSVKEFWVRGSTRLDARLNGFEHLPALEKLVINGRGSGLVRNIRRELSSDHPGILPCPLLSAIDCYGNALEVDEIFLLMSTRSSAGHRLDNLRVPSSFIPLPVDISAFVRDFGSLDTPLKALHMHSMELPEFCFAKGHRWWKLWKSRLR